MWKLEQKYFTNELNNDEFTTEQFDHIEDYVLEGCRDTGWYTDEEIYDFLDEIANLKLGEYASVLGKDYGIIKDFIKVTKIA
jgi:hypothetical protein